jgi:hypothetical protein
MLPGERFERIVEWIDEKAAPGSPGSAILGSE